MTINYIVIKFWNGTECFYQEFEDYNLACECANDLSATVFRKE